MTDTPDTPDTPKDAKPYLIRTNTLASEKELAALFSHNLFEDGPLENQIQVCDGLWKRVAGVGWYFWRWSNVDPKDGDC